MFYLWRTFNKHMNYNRKNRIVITLRMPIFKFKNPFKKLNLLSRNSNDINNNKKIEIFDEKNNDNDNNLTINKKKKILNRCMLCEVEIPEENENEKTLPCNHIFCSDCYLNYFDYKINDNKLGKISCMQHKWPTILNSEFIISHLKENEKSINKYEKFKLKNERIEFFNNHPNIKFCPIPDCESYAQKIKLIINMFNI